MKRTFISILGVAAYIFSALGAQAAIITVEANGKINSVTAGLAGNAFFDIGDSFSLSFTYDDQVPDANAEAGIATYDSILSWSVTFGTYTAIMQTGSGNISIFDNHPALNDNFSASVADFGSTHFIDDGPINGIDFNQSSFSLNDSSQTALTSEFLAGLMLNLSDFTTRSVLSISFLEMIDTDTYAFHIAKGSVDSLVVRVSDVPLPAAAPLMLFGTAVFGFYVRQRKSYYIARRVKLKLCDACC